ncbi:iron ABC transporter substrate-binding protein [Paenibacillus beijingensis]|uniref:Iron ABC transporter substrate-binding protein n=2 Tax=Paenibacillus beijingensis TaxID=1126833 RepID=A0A0D5NS31_9BACL|nr:ABC transporter substrate-binding protein [Paenibacillus beijingensis]AJY77703.1 iron ABC transporter substrate-binding protein [Paenibacillus beijingensis]
MKWLKVSVMLTLLVGVLAACGGSGSEGNNTSGSNKLVVYTPNSETMINALIPIFEKQTGITVELVSAGSGELIKRIQSEKGNAYADVMFGGAFELFNANADLFEKYVSPNDQYLLEGHRNTTGFMTSYVSDGSVMLVNTNLAGDIQINSYADLLKPELKGKIAMADPTNSSSAFHQLTNMLKAKGGDYTSDPGWNYVGGLIENLDGKIAGSSSKAHKSVADGEYMVALTYEDPAASYVRDGAPVRIVYPSEGTVFLDAVAGIVKGAKHEENAKKFIDFLISKEAQDALGTETTNRPLRTDAQLGSYLTPIDQIKMIEEDVVYVSDHKKDIIEKYTDLFTSLSK